MFYLSIICCCLKLKQREVNNYLRKVIENKTKIFNSNQMIAKLKKIYEEIKECDSHFCSSFLALILSGVTYLIALLTFTVLFGNLLYIYMKYVMTLAIIVLIILFLFVIHMSSSVNYESKKTYKLLVSYKLKCLSNNSMVSSARHHIKAIIHSKIISKFL